MLKKILSALGFSSLLIFSGCSDTDQNSTTDTEVKPIAPIIIQGALPIETDYMAAKLSDVELESVGEWKFWKGHYKGYPIIISKTRMGMTNAAAATAIAIEKYHPLAIINQGTSGGHDPELKVYDIVLGKYTTNIGAFKTPLQAEGAGSDALQWTEAFDVLPDDESDPEPLAIRKFEGDANLLLTALQLKSSYSKGTVVEGTIGSADVWNNELDRIQFFHTRYGTSVEEMEAASVAQVAQQFNVPFLAIRILSNNLTNNGTYDAGTAEACQDYVLTVAEAFMKQHSKPIN